MNTIFEFLQKSTDFVVPMTILLGLLIFVHELGHFLVAKYFKVRVEVFSLGFGPKLLKFKRGDTTYAVSAIPLGGYVKMFGDDPTADVQSDQKQFSFSHKPVGQRVWVVLAGPLMNFFFAILLFTGVALIGEQMLAPKLGDVDEKSAAYSAGFRSGDTVQSINGEQITIWDEVQEAIETNGEKVLKVEVTREDGSKGSFEVTPVTVVNKNVLSWKEKVGEVAGLSTASRAAVIGIQKIDSPAYLAGLRSGDIIAAVNGVKVARLRELNAEIEKLTGGTGELVITYQRPVPGSQEEPPSKEVKLDLAGTESSNLSLQKLGIESPELFIEPAGENSPAMKAGLKHGDRVTAVNGADVVTFEDVSKNIRAFNADAGKPLNFSVIREGKAVEVAVSPNLRERMNNQGREEKNFEVGIRSLLQGAAPSVMLLSFKNPITAVVRGYEQTIHWTSMTVLSFVRLFQAQVSAKNIGGFISIGKMAQKSWQLGIAPYLNIMAIISINLFVLNLLPVPVLDGGHLVFYTWEIIRGAPLSLRKMEIAQQVGMILLLGLMAFALFNDFTRLGNG